MKRKPFGFKTSLHFFRTEIGSEKCSITPLITIRSNFSSNEISGK